MSETPSNKPVITQWPELNGETKPALEGSHLSKWTSRCANKPASHLITYDILKYALHLRDSGLSTIPVRADGSKEPALCSWKEYQGRLPTKDELTKWFSGRSQLGIAVIGGSVSGNLEIIDIDSPPLIAEWLNLVEGQAPGLLTGLPQVKTPSGGLHVFYRCEKIAGNTKLAERKVQESKGARGAREREGQWFKFKTTIETRGEGGYVITAGSSPDCHPSGKPYVLLNGDLKAIPGITERAREVALICARAFNERVTEVTGPRRRQRGGPPTNLRPGDDFNQRGDACQTLEKHGWTYLGKGRRGQLWGRPGVDHTSATLFPDGSLYVFSSNAHPFDHNRRYDKFSIYTLLEHGGDWEAAARDLAEQGYGNPRRPR
jgi:Bifunctional DNA primase/polymerase, N-terminal